MSAYDVVMVTDDARVKALAVQYGIFDAISRQLSKFKSNSVVVLPAKHGDTFFAFAAFANFKNKGDNGWLCAFSKNQQAIEGMVSQLYANFALQPEAVSWSSRPNN
jgi:hypothetical protein